MDLTPAPNQRTSDTLRDPRLPKARVHLQCVDAILFVAESAPYDTLVPNLLATAALYRGIALERPGEPLLTVVGEVPLANWAKGFGSSPITRDIFPSQTTLLVTSATFSMRDFAQLAGTYAVRDAFLLGKSVLVDDEVPIGKRKNPRPPVLPLVRHLLGNRGDHIVEELLRLAEEVPAAPEDRCFRDRLGQVLTALQVRSGLRARLERRDPTNPYEKLAELVIDLSSGSRAPSIFRQLGEDFDSARAIASSIWRQADELAPGVFQLYGMPLQEQDGLVRTCLQELYDSDPAVRIVLERNQDRARSSLSAAEATELAERLESGAPARALLKEAMSVLTERRDMGAVFEVERALERRTGETESLRRLIDAALYRPDAEGACTVRKRPKDLDLEHLLEWAGIPLLDHYGLRMIDPAKGTATRTTISFQAKHLTAFLEVVSK